MGSLHLCALLMFSITGEFTLSSCVCFRSDQSEFVFICFLLRQQTVSCLTSSVSAFLFSAACSHFEPASCFGEETNWLAELSAWFYIYRCFLVWCPQTWHFFKDKVTFLHLDQQRDHYPPFLLCFSTQCRISIDLTDIHIYLSFYSCFYVIFMFNLVVLISNLTLEWFGQQPLI